MAWQKVYFIIPTEEKEVRVEKRWRSPEIIRVECDRFRSLL
ncbi:hypothetical protein [Nostoc sp.]